MKTEVENLQKSVSNLIDEFNAGTELDSWTQTEINLISAELALFVSAIYNINYNFPPLQKFCWS